MNINIQQYTNDINNYIQVLFNERKPTVREHRSSWNSLYSLSLVVNISVMHPVIEEAVEKFIKKLLNEIRIPHQCQPQQFINAANRFKTFITKLDRSFCRMV